MSQTLVKKRQVLIESVESLPKDKQDAIKWLIANYDSAASICKAKTLTEDESNKIIHRAEQDDNMYLLVLALPERVLNA